MPNEKVWTKPLAAEIGYLHPENSPMKILVIRFSSLGDVVLAAPVLGFLKRRSGAQIHLLTKPQMGHLLHNGAGVDRFLEWGDEGLMQQLIAENYDAILDLHCNFRSHWVRLRLLGVAAFGYQKRRVFRGLFVQFKQNQFAVNHVAERYLLAAMNLLNFLGLGEKFGPSLKSPMIKQQNDWTAGLFRCPNPHVLGALKIEPRYAVAVLGGTYATKKIPIHLWQWIIEIDQTIQWVGIGGALDQGVASQLSALFPSRFLNLTQQLSLTESANVIQHSVRVVGGDTGFTHVAAAHQKPLLVIWGNTHPGLGFAAGYGVNDEKTLHMLPKSLACHPCNKLGFDACPKQHFHCMQAHSFEEVQLFVQNLQGLSL